MVRLLWTIDFVLSAPFAPLLIDAIGNDSDSDGTISYVLGEDGLPVAIDPQESTGFETDGGLLGEVEWSVADQAFLYTAPTDVS